MNSPASKFEIHGYFESLFDLERNKALGTRKVELEPGRALGEDGAREIIIEADVELDRGPKKATFRASKSRPIRCKSVVYPLCGRILR